VRLQIYFGQCKSEVYTDWENDALCVLPGSHNTQCHEHPSRGIQHVSFEKENQNGMNKLFLESRSDYLANRAEKLIARNREIAGG